MLSKSEMNSFKERLLNRKAQIERNLYETNQEMQGIRRMDPKDEGDYASISAETAVDSAILEQQQKELAEIDLALDKIVAETYGICEMCEEPIGVTRLNVKIFARFCITCREITEKEHH